MVSLLFTHTSSWLAVHQHLAMIKLYTPYISLSPPTTTGNTVLLLGMLKYAQGARVVADTPHTTPEDDKKTD